MAESLAFDLEQARRLERLYNSADILRRRRLVQGALAARPGDRVLDLGPGPGFYLPEIAADVTPGGSVLGVEPSDAMRTVAAGRCVSIDAAEVIEGSATAIPVTDASFDRALTVQVLEYVSDVAAALAELHRVLRPGGRLVVWDIDWATVSWHSDEPDRMARVLDAWDGHLEHRSLPAVLRPALVRAGFEQVEVEGHSFINLDAGADSYSGTVLPLIADYVVARGGIEPATATAWADEQETLSREGRYYFACVQFCFTATRI